MNAFYNDTDRFCCDWLSNLMDAGLVTAGRIDDRSIEDISPDDLKGYERVHLFAGIGGWDYALQLAGWGGAVWTGSCPCQPFSNAGKRKGQADDRHLWPAFRSLVSKCKPPVVFGEQVASPLGREWLARVRADVEALGYACGAADLCAASVGAKHARSRLWWVAHTERDKQWRRQPRCGQAGRVGRIIEPVPWNESWESALSRLRALDDGIPRRVVATDAARNAIVPQVAAEFVMAAMAEQWG